MQFDQGDRDVLGHILRWRRDVRQFRTDPLSEDVISRLQQRMGLAPSVGNARPWRVFRVRDMALRASVRAEFERCNAEAAAAYDDVVQEEYLQLKLAGLDAAPEHLAIFTVTDPPEGRGLGRRTMPGTLHQSTAMAIHTLWLAARVENIGVGMVSILDPAVIETLFDTPHGWQFSAYLCMGWPEFVDDTPLLHRTGWQKNQPTGWKEI